ncbi:MAG: AAA family ATPase [Nitrosomonas sp.]|nr:AAA family ATPase [Nitrosomonas sp.]
MKRASSSSFVKKNEKDSKKQTKGQPLFYLEFSIKECKIPKSNDEFDGYFQGTVQIHACPTRPTLVGASVRMINYRLMSIAPFFVYSTKAAVDSGDGTITVEKDAADFDLCNVQRLKYDLTRSEVKDLVERFMIRENFNREMKDIGYGLVMSLPQSVPMQIVANALPNSDLFRLPLKQAVYGYFINGKFDTKQKTLLDQLNIEGLKKLKQTLVSEPWSLVWLKKDTLSLTEKKLRKVVADYLLHEVFPLHIQYAVTIYFRILALKEDEQHTCFPKRMFNMIIPAMEAEKRIVLEKQVYDYLAQHEVIVFTPSPSPGGGGEEFLCLKKDFTDAQMTLKALLDIQQRAISATEEPFTLRGTHVPQLFPELTPRQKEIALHIQKHWLTIVEGLPGTGKTALITWCVSHYANVMLTSFVGMMVKSLQRRNGRRTEIAHTIHRLIALKKFNSSAETWFEKFEVLVLDEFSNVSMSLFRKLICLFPNLQKVVLVGDHRQLKPIEGGDPMGDLLSLFGSQMLYDNLRVIPGLRNLQMAPLLISDGRAKEISYTGPISFLKKQASVADTLFSIFGPLAHRRNILMSMHIVVLINKNSDGRKHLNKECESVWQKLGVLKKPPQGGVVLTGAAKRLELYPGCKITFSKNYNRPYEFTNAIGKKQKTDTVANGELAIVKHIQECDGGYVLTVVDSEDEADMPETKVLFIGMKNGINPVHVDMGYATTTYKTQGKLLFVCTRFF